MKHSLIFLLILVLIVVLSGCSVKGNSANDTLFAKLRDIPDFAGYHHSLWYDTETGVIYMCAYGLHTNSFTPLYNADGSLKIWDGYKEG